MAVSLAVKQQRLQLGQGDLCELQSWHEGSDTPKKSVPEISKSVDLMEDLGFL